MNIINPYRFAAAGGPSYLFEENFEGTGYENTWTESGTGTKDEDYATGPLEGSQSLRLVFASHNGLTYATLPSSEGTLEWYFMVNFATLPASGKVFARLRDASSNSLLRLEVSTGNILRIRHGTGTVATVDTITTGTTYHIWLRYVKGTGSNGQGSVAFSTDGVRPTSGNSYAALTNGSLTADANQVLFGTENTSAWEGLFDRVIADTGTIGDNP